jgi:hypothetical protein
MRKRYNFSIDSEFSEHTLSLDGKAIATFATLDAAEAAANGVAKLLVPGAKLQFGLDFKWTLSDLELRAATLERESLPANGHEDSVCGS